MYKIIYLYLLIRIRKGMLLYFPPFIIVSALHGIPVLDNASAGRQLAIQCTLTSKSPCSCFLAPNGIKHSANETWSCSIDSTRSLQGGKPLSHESRFIDCFMDWFKDLILSGPLHEIGFRVATLHLLTPRETHASARQRGKHLPLATIYCFRCSYILHKPCLGVGRQQVGNAVLERVLVRRPNSSQRHEKG